MDKINENYKNNPLNIQLNLSDINTVTKEENSKSNNNNIFILDTKDNKNKNDMKKSFQNNDLDLNSKKNIFSQTITESHKKSSNKKSKFKIIRKNLSELSN